MNGNTHPSRNRRLVLEATGLSAAGVVSLGTPVGADGDDADVEVSFRDQETDGGSILIDSLATDTDAELLVFESDGDRTRYETREIEAGTEFTDRTIDLEEPIPEEQKVSLSVQPPEGGYSYGGDRATVSIDESLDEPVPDEAIQLVDADSDAGFHFPYLVYAPDVSSDTGGPDTRPLLVSLSPRTGTTSEEAERLESGRSELERGLVRAVADELGVPALVALLPYRPDDESFRHLDHNSLQESDPPLERLDLQLLAMVDDARERLEDEPYDVATEFHADGYSSNGRFFNKFMMLHPDRLNAVSSGGNGTVRIPKAELDEEFPTVGDPDTAELPWPIGVADLEELTGEPFDEDAWADVAQFQYIGSEDQWDPDEHDHPREYRHSPRFTHFGEERQELLLEIFGWKQVDERFETSKEIIEHIGSSAEFVVYDGAEHTVTDEMAEDILDFHREHIAETFGPTDDADEAADESEMTDTDDEGTSDDSDGETEQDDDQDGEAEGSDAEEQPGLGVLGSIAAIGGVSYLLKRRVSSNEPGTR